jgi:flagellar hook-associated protein 2
VGSLTLTLGVGELLNRSLYHITDSTYGFLTDKLDTIQKTIQNYDEDIARMQTQTDQKMADLENRFIAMETALSTMKSQSDWLSAQISSLSGNWG